MAFIGTLLIAMAIFSLSRAVRECADGIKKFDDQD